MKLNASTFVSVVVSISDQGAILDKFVPEVAEVLDSHYQNFEIVIVDDCSSDNSVLLLQDLMQRHAGLRLIRLSRHFGTEVGTIAGLESSIGDVVVVLSPDSDPPDAIPGLVQLAQAGNDLVRGLPVNPPSEGWMFRLCRAAFYLICNKILGLNLPRTSTTMCAFTRRAVNALTRVKQKQRHLSLLCCSVGFAQTSIPYEKIFRSCRPRRRRLFEAIDLGISLLVTNSMSPLRFIGYLGGFAGFMNLLYVIYVFAVNLVKKNVAEGWTTLSLQTAFMFFFVFLILVLMAEYISHISEETKDKPLYHVLEEISGPVVTDTGMRNVLEYSTSLTEPQRLHRGKKHDAA